MAWPAFTFFDLKIFSYATLQRPRVGILLQKAAFY